MRIRNRALSMTFLALGLVACGWALLLGVLLERNPWWGISAALLLTVAGLLTADLRGPRDPYDPRPRA